MWCTGYRVSMPFLDQALVGDDPRELPLYKRVFHLDREDLFFVGLMQSTGSAFPIVERQAQLVAEYATGRWAPPSRATMRTDCARRRRAALKRWGAHGRPGMRVDFDGFMHELERELRAGERRAARNGGRRPPGGSDPAPQDGEHAVTARRRVSRTALVTGASGAFGTAVRGELRSRGWRVAGLDLRPDPGDPEVLACDVTDDAAVPEAVAAAVERLGGRLDALVNNAGIGGPASAGGPPDEHVRRMLDVNLLGSWRVTAAAIDHLVESRGRVVLVASRMSFIGLPLGAAYGVSKRALVAYADALRAEYGTHVGVTCVHPAMVRTPIHDATRDAGLQLEGFSREEPLEAVTRTIVDACESARPRRDVAVTRAGGLQLAVARHLPAVVDRVVARLLSKAIAAGDLDGAPLAAGLRARHARSGSSEN